MEHLSCGKFYVETPSLIGSQVKNEGLCLCVFVCLCMFVFVCMYVCLFVSVCLCMCMDLCVCLCMCVCMFGSQGNLDLASFFA